MIHAFGPFRLDTDTQTLFRGGEPVALGRRAVALLHVLIERPGAPGLEGHAARGSVGWLGR